MMKTLRMLFNQPKGVFLIAFVQLWHEFSYYGMRALLVLFMISVLKFSDSYAFGVFAVFCCLVEFGGILGAALADKILGLRAAILLGGWIMALGHLALALELFFPGLALLIVGSSLFQTNIAAFVGHFYEADDEKRSSGFTIFYMSINIGALIATILCGVLAESYGWSYGFGLAAIGMLIGNIVLMKKRHLLEGKGEAPINITRKQKTLVLPILSLSGVLATGALLLHDYALPILPIFGGALIFSIFRGVWKDNSLSKRNVGKLGLYLMGLVVFFAAEEQIASSLLVFTDRMATNTLFGFPVSSTSILTLNPFVVITCGGIVAALFIRMKALKFLRFFLPFLIAALAYASLLVGNGQKPISNVMLVVAAISFAELLLGPAVYTVCSEISTRKRDPKIMALIPIGFSLAATLGGVFSKMIARSEYSYGFLELAAILVVGGAILGGALAYLLKERELPATQ